MAENATILKIRLGAELRALRDKQKLTLEAAVQALHERDVEFSVSKINRLENGKGAVRLADINALLDLYGGTDAAQRETLISLAREAKANSRGGTLMDEGQLPSGFSTYIGMEEVADRLLTFTLVLVDGLLQTPDYARALLQASLATERAARVDALVDVRVQRQKILTAANPVELVTVLDEAALTKPIGGRDIMRGQLNHLLNVCDELPNVSIQVIPTAKGAYGTEHSMFTLIEPRNPADKPLVYIDSLAGNLYLPQQDQVTRFRGMFGRLQAIALDRNETREIIRTKLEEL